MPTDRHSRDLVLHRPKDTSTSNRDDESPLYIVDKRGDPLIAKYGGNERSKIPFYRRFGRNKILGGAGERIEVTWEGSHEVFSLGSRSRDGSSAFRDKALARKVWTFQPVRYLPRRTVQHEEEEEESTGHDLGGFIALSRPRKRQRIDSSDEDEMQRDYRSIKGKAKASPCEGLDGGSDQSSNDAQDDREEFLRRRSTLLSKRIKSVPSDIDAWFELVDLQEALLRLDSRDKDAVSVAGLAAVRVALLEEVLPHAQIAAEREKVSLLLMREGTNIWSPEGLSKRWANLNPAGSSFKLWRAYFDHVLCIPKIFTLNTAKEIGLARLELLRQRLDRKKDGKTSVDTMFEAVYVTLLLSRLLYDAGFTETGIAVWQAMLELTFARPDHLDKKQDTALDELESFWDDEHNRLGEENAKGWRGTDSSTRHDVAISAQIVTTPARADLYESWASAERQRSASAQGMPVRADYYDDPGNDDNPFRLVTFADIKPFLLVIPDVLLGEVREMVYDAFLIFCRLPPASRNPNAWIHMARNDPFLAHGHIDLNSETDFQDNHEAQRHALRQDEIPSRMALAPIVLIPVKGWLHYLPRPGELAGFAHRVSIQLGELGHAVVFEYALSLLSCSDPKGVRKAAKRFLKKANLNPDDAANTYNTFAHAIHASGDAQMATDILRQAASAVPDPWKQQLHNSRAWSALYGRGKSTVLSHLLSTLDPSAAGDSVHGQLSPAHLLKVRKLLQTATSLGPSPTNSAAKSASTFAVAQMLFEYCAATGDSEPMSSTQGNIAAAMEVVRSFIDEATRLEVHHSADVERVLQDAARLLYHHADRGPFRPPFIQAQLRGFITVFAQNTMFLSLYTWATSYSNILPITDPVREILRSVCLKGPHDCLTSRLFGISHDHYARGNAYSVRKAFEEALGSEACKSNAELWQSYIHFCHSNEELRLTAKEIYQRAVAQCPWSKDLALLAFTTLRKLFDDSELRLIHDDMCDKGMRIFEDLDTFEEKRKEQRQTQTS